MWRGNRLYNFLLGGMGMFYLRTNSFFGDYSKMSFFSCNLWFSLKKLCLRASTWQRLLFWPYISTNKLTRRVNTENTVKTGLDASEEENYNFFQIVNSYPNSEYEFPFKTEILYNLEVEVQGSRFIALPNEIFSEFIYYTLKFEYYFFFFFFFFFFLNKKYSCN